MWSFGSSTIANSCVNSAARAGLPWPCAARAAAPLLTQPGFGDCRGEKGEVSPMRVSRTDTELHRFTASAKQCRVGLRQFAPANAPAVQKCWVKNRIMSRENHGRVGVGVGVGIGIGGWMPCPSGVSWSRVPRLPGGHH